ncbi:hypothetical protein F4860DRAFT_510845 [Xylaria cubensis]|nr:hypothetical protein F4860DRAFT_510845 [Xylaria cubensis]
MDKLCEAYQRVRLELPKTTSELHEAFYRQTLRLNQLVSMLSNDLIEFRGDGKFQLAAALADVQKYNSEVIHALAVFRKVGAVEKMESDFKKCLQEVQESRARDLNHMQAIITQGFKDIQSSIQNHTTEGFRETREKLQAHTTQNLDSIRVDIQAHTTEGLREAQENMRTYAATALDGIQSSIQNHTTEGFRETQEKLQAHTTQNLDGIRADIQAQTTKTLHKTQEKLDKLSTQVLSHMPEIAPTTTSEDPEVSGVIKSLILERYSGIVEFVRRASFVPAEQWDGNSMKVAKMFLEGLDNKEAAKRLLSFAEGRETEYRADTMICMDALVSVSEYPYDLLWAWRYRPRTYDGNDKKHPQRPEDYRCSRQRGRHPEYQRRTGIKAFPGAQFPFNVIINVRPGQNSFLAAEMGLGEPTSQGIQTWKPILKRNQTRGTLRS